jgi:hypothetical protein
MGLRMRLLRGANALLYLGPLFAGLSDFGWGMVASFTAIFMVWLIVLRPEQWPSTLQEWQTASGWLSALTIILSQVFLVAMLFAVGRGIGAVAGFLPVVNPQLPLAISFLAIPLSRLLWDAREAADRGVFLDDEAEAANVPRAAAAAAASIVPLLNLPDDAPDRLVTEEVAKVLASPAAELRLRTLAATLAQPDRSHSALRRALIIWASEPEIVAPGWVPNSMALGFAIADRNSDLLRVYTPRALALIAAFPDRAADFPSGQKLREIAKDDLSSGPFSDLPDHLTRDLRDGLVALAAAVDRAVAPPQAPVERVVEPVVHKTARIA